MAQKLTVGKMRDLEKKLQRGDISYSRMVEIINETTKPNDNDIARVYDDWYVIRCTLSLREFTEIVEELTMKVK